MPTCDFCGKNIEGVLPHRCKYCGQTHCSEHLLPESHNCRGLERIKDKGVKKWKNEFNKFNNYENKKFKNKGKKENLYLKIRNYCFMKYSNLTYWLKNREHQRYNYEARLNYLITTILIFVASIIGISIFYSNAEKLNQINLWIIKLGGVLIIFSLFFAIKFGWKLGKEGINILKRQRNWIKYLIIILIIILLWQAYTNKDTVLNPVFDKYNKTNFSLFVPISLGNLSFDNNSNYSSKDNSKFNNFIQGVIEPKSQIDISELELEVHRLINVERQKNGLNSLSFDSKLADIARKHSEDMAQNNFFEHTNLKGQDPTDRANAVGYSCRKDYRDYYTYGIGENIAETPIYSNVEGCDSTTNLESLASCIVDGWMGSPGHRKNILTSEYGKEGIGIAYSSDDKAYTTEDFC